MITILIWIIIILAILRLIAEWLCKPRIIKVVSPYWVKKHKIFLYYHWKWQKFRKHVLIYEY